MSNNNLIRIIGDQPWAKTDSPEFHFSEYASTLAEVALNPNNETPLCILVQGEWGVGKSTLMETIRNEIKDAPKAGRRAVKSVWFNAWKYKDATPVMAGLLGTLLKEIGKGALKEQFQEQFLKNRGRIAKAIIYAFPAMLDKLITDNAIKEQIESCSTNIDTILSKCDEIDVFQQAFLEVATAWLMDKWGDTTETIIDDKKYCLAVFIDDLDRCDGEQIKAVLEAIKLFLDFPGVCFYLAMDQHQLDQYLKGIFKDRSKDALDKFVQVIFSIPAPPQEDFKVYVEGLLAGHPMEAFLQKDDKEMLAVNLPANPRSAKRYLNDLAVWFSVFSKINRGLSEEVRDSLMPYAGRYHLLAHAIQKRDRSKWNAKAGSAEVLLTWWKSLKEKVGEKPDGEDDSDFHLANSTGLMTLVSWMLDPVNRPEENLGLIVDFRKRLIEPITPSASGRRINPFTWIRPIGKDYEMCAYPVTQKLYFDTMGENPSQFRGQDTEDNPVETVSWLDVVKFCNRLSEKRGMDVVYQIDPKTSEVTWNRELKGFRLPTEEEWEYACLAGRDDPYGPLDDIAWYDKNSEGKTHPVGQKKPNAWGLYDMLGNVWEWCWDLYEEKNPLLVIRGGSWNFSVNNVPASVRGCNWNFSVNNVRASVRGEDVFGARLSYVGFRICRDC